MNLLTRSGGLLRRGFLLGILCLSAAGAEERAARIAVIPMGATHQFWKSIHAGAVKAQRELQARGVNVEVIWKGPLKEDDRGQQIEVVENFVGSGVKGIVIAPLDSRALVAPLEDAVRAHIPVVIIGSPLQSTAPVSFIATDNRLGGRIGARRLGELLAGRGNVILLRVVVGSAAAEEREAGFLEEMRASFPGIRLLSVDQHGGVTRDTAYRTAQNLLNRFGREVNGIFTPNESTTSGMLLALRDAGLAQGRVKFVGFDASPNLVAGLRAGDLQGLVVQDPVKMGYLGVLTVVAAGRHESVPAFVDTGVTLVSAENLADPAVAALLNPPLDEFLR